MTVQLLDVPGLAPTAPYAYAATAAAGHRPVQLAGACPLDADGRTVAPGDVAAQTARCLDNLVTALDAAGAALTDVLGTRVLVATTDRRDLHTAWDVVEARFAEHAVPSTLLGVTVLGYPDQLVEIEAWAAVP
ncbi:enamine deaminase RidA (YjgF/YER057c/UK114 family) [Isoptericola sp. CG 20/1183]|uniref:Enamine deaminase RidA (YjgF/YER057c/UK114 family) n=1 Tax=Isoptericola halotolerans TaxID=300560 RepID=A0ABX5EGW4_9MICO|nr:MULTISPECIES: Rid family hydrolase [Isoptericola]PRZ08565.1 enamine deaminase RidA (YjgF/YER057c/UK114 family) [Isoptericola halotolerans]PRZ10988.1 enamine deaminase RidA (YjgF/YER057c/UK114 family) [Isoptericola sp. CG 20/1183]